MKKNKKKGNNRNKYSTLRLFNKLSQRAYKISKKQGLGWKFADAQRFVSANVYQDYKGTTRVSKLRVTEVDRLVELKLDQPSISTPTSIPLPTPKPKPEVCKNPKDYASTFFESFDWFDIVDKLSIFADNMYIELDLEVSGVTIVRTGEVKVSNLPNLLEVREDIRKEVPNSPVLQIALEIAVREGREDDDKDCSYFVLATFEGSDAYMRTMPRFAKVGFKSKKDMSFEDLVTIEEKEMEIEQLRKEAMKKKAVKTVKRPDKVETPPEKATALSSDEVKLEKIKAYNIAVDELKQLYDKGLITKKMFQKRFEELGKNLKQGGVV